MKRRYEVTTEDGLTALVEIASPGISIIIDREQGHRRVTDEEEWTRLHKQVKTQTANLDKVKAKSRRTPKQDQSV